MKIMRNELLKIKLKRTSKSKSLDIFLSPMFLSNTALIFLGFALTLLVFMISIYLYSSGILSRELDSASQRTLNKVQNTMNMILEQTGSMSMRMAISPDTISLTSVKHPFGNLNKVVDLKNRVFNDMKVSQRLKIDLSIMIYSPINEYIIDTSTGGLNLRYYPDDSMVKSITSLINARYKYGYVLRHSLVNDVWAWMITHYRAIEDGTKTPTSFVAINLSSTELGNILSSVQDDGAGEIMILDEHQTVIVDTSKHYIGEHIRDVFPDLFKEGILNSDAFGALDFESFTSGVELTHEEELMRLTFNTSSTNRWTYIQLLPHFIYAKYTLGFTLFFWMSLSIGLLVSLFISFLISSKLSKPIYAMHALMESPETFNEISDYSGETRLMLMKILSTYEKSARLEGELLVRYANLKSERARALQEQMTPHFIYNTLQAINWLVMMDTGKDNSSASDAIGIMSDIVRTCMEGGDNICRLEDELIYTEKYIKLLCLRYGDTLTTEIDVPRELLGQAMLKLALQPLVENAVVHGIHAHGDKGHIKISVRLVGDIMRISVEDDGSGMPDAKIASFNQSFADTFSLQNRHIGLLNLNHRIKLVFGEKYGLEIEKSVLGGISVTVVIPKG